MTTATPEARPAAEALFAEGGWSAKQIAEQVGVSDRTVKRWRKDWKAAGNKPGGSRAPARAPAHKAEPAEPLPRPEKPTGPEIYDDPVLYWKGQVRLAQQRGEQAIKARQTSASAQWARIEHFAAQELGKAMQSRAEEEDRKRRSLDRDPVDLLRRVIKLIPTLLRAAPDMAEELRKAIDAVVPRQ